MTVSDAYAKMLQIPKNRISSSGMMKQPAPGSADIAGADMSNVNETTGTDSKDAAYFAGVDARMAARASGAPANESAQPTNSIETRLKEIEDLLVEVMKVHMKIVKKGLV